MNVAATLNGINVIIVEMIPSQPVGSFHIIYVNLVDNNLYMAQVERMDNLNWEDLDNTLATNVTAVDGVAI